MHKYNSVAVKWLFIGFLCFFLVNSLIGCGTSPLKQAAEQLTGQQLTNLSPEQLSALDKTGQSVVSCILANGPPGAGSLVFLIVPKSAAGTVTFGPDCHPTSTITLNGLPAPVTPTQ